MIFIRDRFRTVCNITGDSFGAAVVEKFSRDDFGPELELEQPNLIYPEMESGQFTLKDDGESCRNSSVTKM